MHAITSMTLSKNVPHGPSPLNGTSHHLVGIPCGWLRLTAISDGGLCKAVRWNLLEINFPTLKFASLSRSIRLLNFNFEHYINIMLEELRRVE